MIRFMSDTRYAGLEKEMQHMILMDVVKEWDGYEI